MQRIVDNLRSSPEDERRGIIKRDEDRTEGDVIEIRIGRKRDDRGRIDLEAKPTITLGLPVVKEANGATHPRNPMEARLRNLNYTAPIYLDFTVIENGIEREPERVHIGNFPIMVKSKRCLLYKENMETEGELTSDEYKRKRIEMGEDPYDPGGYFIIGGTERALISLEDLAPNRVLVEFNERYGRKVEVAKVFSQKEGYRALTLMEKKKDGQLIVSVPTASGQIPLIILMKSLGMERRGHLQRRRLDARDGEHRLREHRGMPEQEGLPAERDFHAGRCDQLPGEEVRDGAGERVPDQEGRIDPGPILVAASRRHP